MLSKSRLLIVTLWVGALWAVGFIVAPTLFATLSDRALAGAIAGSLFRIVGWLSLACGIALLLLRAGRASSSRHVTLMIVAMMACTLLGYFALQPFMAEAREVMYNVASSVVQMEDAKKRFGILHATSTGFYVLQSLIGAVLVLRLR